MDITTIGLASNLAVMQTCSLLHSHSSTVGDSVDLMLGNVKSRIANERVASLFDKIVGLLLFAIPLMVEYVVLSLKDFLIAKKAAQAAEAKSE